MSLCLNDFSHHCSVSHPLHQTFGLFLLAQTWMFVPKCKIHQRHMGLTEVRRFNNPKKVCAHIQRWQGVGSRGWWRRSRQQAAELLDDTCLMWGFKSRLLEDGDLSWLHPEKDGNWHWHCIASRTRSCKQTSNKINIVIKKATWQNITDVI